MRSRLSGAVAVMAAASVLAACGGDGSGSDSGLRVVVSDPPLADMAKRVAGDRAEVVGVVPLGADGHTYQPRPEDAKKLAKADIFFETGMGLNNALAKFASDNYPEGTPHVSLAQAIPRREILATDTPEQVASHGHAHSFNAHFWPDPVYAALYVDAIQAELAKVDPEGAEGYKSRADAFVQEIDRLHDAFKTAIATIPEQSRKLVVYHDSWSYFGRRYGLPVIGNIQPADFSEPSAAEVRATIDQVKAAGVPAFFGSEVFPSDVLETIAEETGAKYVADLSDDKLPGKPGGPEHGYVGMMVANVRSIVSALGGDTAALDAVDPAKKK